MCDVCIKTRGWLELEIFKWRLLVESNRSVPSAGSKIPFFPCQYCHRRFRCTGLWIIGTVKPTCNEPNQYAKCVRCFSTFDPICNEVGNNRMMDIMKESLVFILNFGPELKKIITKPKWIKWKSLSPPSALLRIQKQMTEIDMRTRRERYHCRERCILLFWCCLLVTLTSF